MYQNVSKMQWSKWIQKYILECVECFKRKFWLIFSLVFYQFPKYLRVLVLFCMLCDHPHFCLFLSFSKKVYASSKQIVDKAVL